MTLQTDLQNAVDKAKTDTELLHNIVHGDDKTVITTEGGEVKSPAKLITDIEQTIQSKLTDLDKTANKFDQAINSAGKQATKAQHYAQKAENIAGGLNLPHNLRGQAGKLLAVNQSEDGYDTVQSKTVFYGLRKQDKKLIVETGNGLFDIKRFCGWIVTLQGVKFSIADNGHLFINI